MVAVTELDSRFGTHKLSYITTQKVTREWGTCDITGAIVGGPFNREVERTYTAICVCHQTFWGENLDIVCNQLRRHIRNPFNLPE